MVSFDLVNEPAVNRGPTALTAADLNDWYAAVIPVIRATGGRNADRMLWLEPYGRYEDLKIPVNAGNVGVSPHCYDDYQYTHKGAKLTAACMSIFASQVSRAVAFRERTGIPVWFGEMGVKASQTDARNEYLQFIGQECARQGVPGCYWAYSNDFALVDQKTRQWLPGVVDALTGKGTVRPVPTFKPLTGGRLAVTNRQPDKAYAKTCSITPDGVFNAPLNTENRDVSLILAFPDIEAAPGQQWALYVPTGEGFKLAATLLGTDDSPPAWVTGGPFYLGKQGAPGGWIYSFANTQVSGAGYLGVAISVPAGARVVNAQLTALQVS